MEVDLQSTENENKLNFIDSKNKRFLARIYQNTCQQRIYNNNSKQISSKKKYQWFYRFINV